MDLEGIILSKIRQRKTIPYDLTYIWNLKKKKKSNETIELIHTENR